MVVMKGRLALFSQGLLSPPNHNEAKGDTVVVNKSLRSVYVQQSFYGEKRLRKWCEIIAMSTFIHTVFTVYKCSKTYSGRSLCPALFYLGYVLGPGSLSLLVFVRCPQLLQNRRCSGNAIDRFRKTPAHQAKALELAHPFKVWLIF